MILASVHFQWKLQRSIINFPWDPIAVNCSRFRWINTQANNGIVIQQINSSYYETIIKDNKYVTYLYLINTFPFFYLHSVYLLLFYVVQKWMARYTLYVLMLAIFKSSLLLVVCDELNLELASGQFLLHQLDKSWFTKAH